MNRSLCVPAVALLVAGCADARPFRRPPPPVAAVGADAVRADCAKCLGSVRLRPVPPPAPLPPPITPVAAVDPPPPGCDPPAYHLGCPDVVEVTFADRPARDVVAAVDVDGHLPLTDDTRVRVEGLTEVAARDAVAAAAGVPPDRVTVRVVDARSARVFVCGPENGKQRPVAYRGPERAVEFLWRVGAVKRGCSDLTDVYVVRSNVAGGGRPEVLRVDVAAVVLDGDPRTNVVLRPSDQVYVGETRRSRFGRLVPEWLQPLYRKLVGIIPTDLWPRLW